MLQVSKCLAENPFRLESPLISSHRPRLRNALSHVRKIGVVAAMSRSSKESGLEGISCSSRIRIRASSCYFLHRLILIINSQVRTFKQSLAA